MSIATSFDRQTTSPSATLGSNQAGGFLDDKPAPKTKEVDLWVPDGKGNYVKHTVYEPARPNSDTRTSTGSWRSQKELPTLRFTPYAWAKLCYLRDIGPTEIGGYLVGNENDVLLIEDFQMPKQFCTESTVKFDPVGIAQLSDQLYKENIGPERYCHWWAHTHPGTSASPSSIDEETFFENFGDRHIAMMFILARGGEVYCRLRCNGVVGFSVNLNAVIDWSKPFPGTDHATWKKEYDEKVSTYKSQMGFVSSPGSYLYHSQSSTGPVAPYRGTNDKKYWWDRHNIDMDLRECSLGQEVYDAFVFGDY